MKAFDDTEQSFSNINMHSNHLRILLKCRFWSSRLKILHIWQAIRWCSWLKDHILRRKKRRQSQRNWTRPFIGWPQPSFSFSSHCFLCTIYLLALSEYLLFPHIIIVWSFLYVFDYAVPFAQNVLFSTVSLENSRHEEHMEWDFLCCLLKKIVVVIIKASATIYWMYFKFVALSYVYIISFNPYNYLVRLVTVPIL